MATVVVEDRELTTDSVQSEFGAQRSSKAAPPELRSVSNFPGALVQMQTLI